jgi:TPR repeat protein
LIQTVIPLADGSAIRLTTNKCHLPSGRLIDKAGIVPDYDIGSRECALGAFKDGERDLATRIAVQILKHASTGSKEDLQRAAQARAQGENGSPHPTGSLKEAGTAFDRGDYQGAIRLLVPLADAGDVSAQATLGAMYLTGLGVAKDESKAAYWTRMAAEAGNVKAQANLGLIYLYGRAVPQDDAEAARWLKKAAIQGNAGAQSSLGVLFLEGRGVEKNYAGAKALFSSAIKGGEVGAANNLAKMIEQGLGQPPDVKAALALYEIAAKFGDPAAQNRVGLACMNGEFRDRDMRAARDWFMKSASQGDKYGQFHLGMFLLDERPADTLPALQWISLSARQGYEPAQSELTARIKTLDDSKKAAGRPILPSLCRFVEGFRQWGIRNLNIGRTALGVRREPRPCRVRAPFVAINHLHRSFPPRFGRRS